MLRAVRILACLLPRYLIRHEIDLLYLRGPSCVMTSRVEVGLLPTASRFTPNMISEIPATAYACHTAGLSAPADADEFPRSRDVYRHDVATGWYAIEPPIRTRMVER